MSDPPPPPALELPEPLPPDPKSIGAGAAFADGCRAWLRTAVPLTALMALLVLPLVVLFALSAPTLAPQMLTGGLGADASELKPEAIPPREWLGFAGVLLLGWVFGGLVTMAALVVGARVLAGGTPPPAGEVADRVLEGVPRTFLTYALFLAVVLVPPVALSGLFALLAMLVPSEGGRMAGALLFLLLLVVAVLPLLVAIAHFLRFGPLLAVLRGEGPTAALRRSIALVRGRWWRTFGFALLVGLCGQAWMTGAMSAGVIARAWHPLAPVLLYGAAAALVIPFQVALEVSLLRRLEATREVDRGAAEEPGTGDLAPV